MELVMQSNGTTLLGSLLSQVNFNFEGFNPAVFSSIGVALSSLSGLLFHYQQFATAGVVYMIALLFHGMQRIISTAGHQTSHATRLLESIKLHLSNSVVISIILTSQLSSPVPGMILAMILVANLMRKYLHFRKAL